MLKKILALVISIAIVYYWATYKRSACTQPYLQALYEYSLKQCLVVREGDYDGCIEFSNGQRDKAEARSCH
jgi:hypothetical protein